MRHRITVESGDGTAARWIVECFARNAPERNLPIDWDASGLTGTIDLADAQFHQLTVTVRSGQSAKVTLEPRRPIVFPPNQSWPVEIVAGEGLGNQADKTVHFFTGQGA